MSFGRRAGGLIAFATWMVACNELTGIGTLGVDEAPADQDVDATIGGDPPRSDASNPTAPADAGTDTTINDAMVMDVTVDSPLPPTPDAGPCVPTSVGPRYGAAADAPLGTWSSRTGILGPDNSPAHSNGANNAAIVTSGYGFTLPSGAQIKGIKVEIARTAAGPVSDSAIALPKGSSKANGSWPQGPIPGPYVTATYGSSTELWGASWTAADINQTTFGVSLTVSGLGDGHPDSIGVTVYYCP